MWGLNRKLSLLSKDLRQWNKDIFGNIFDAVSLAETKVKCAEREYDSNPTDSTRSVYHQHMAELQLAQKRAYLYWKQKANIKWMKDGDANTSFFHHTVKRKRCHQMIRKITKQDGTILEQHNDIQAEAVRYFSNLFAEEPISDCDSILCYIPSLITAEDNTMLTAIPLMSEVKDSVWDLSPTSAAGPDGYPGSFYRRFWPHIQNDVHKAFQEFFLGIRMPKAVAAASVILIPKFSNPNPSPITGQYASQILFLKPSHD